MTSVQGCSPLATTLPNGTVVYDHNRAANCPTTGLNGNGNPVLLTVRGKNFVRPICSLPSVQYVRVCDRARIFS